jgi:hypothetical protein
MAIREDNRELFSTLSELVATWGLDQVVESLIDVCDENARSGNDQIAWQENGSRLERARDKFYSIEKSG